MLKVFVSAQFGIILCQCKYLTETHAQGAFRKPESRNILVLPRLGYLRASLHDFFQGFLFELHVLLAGFNQLRDFVVPLLQ